MAATTLGELYAAAERAQARGEWDPRDAAWCSAIRTLFNLASHAQVALLCRELGARPVDGAA